MEKSSMQSPISRRTLLKIVAGTGIGITGSMFLPSKWFKPALKVGVLPVHAQTSGSIFTILSSVEEVIVLGGTSTSIHPNAVAPANNSFRGTVFISPEQAGVSMSAKWQIQNWGDNDYGAWTDLQPVLTDAAGKAFWEVDTGSAQVHLFQMAYSFTNPAVCTTGCTLTGTYEVQPT